MRCEGALARLESSRAIPFLEKIFCTDSSGVTSRHNRALSYIERPPLLGRCTSPQSTARASFCRRLLLISSGRRRNRLSLWSDSGYNRSVLGESR